MTVQMSTQMAIPITLARARALIIETPEGVAFSFELATPVTRSLAWVLDAVAIGGISYGAGQVCKILGALDPDWAKALSAVLYFAVSIGYGIAMEWHWRGQTVGKRLLGLRVIDAHGMRLQLPQIALRNLLRLVDTLPLLYLVGGIACLVTRKSQRLGDLAANTVVVRVSNWEQPDLEQMAGAKYNSLLAYPTLAARLRSLANPEAVALAVRAIALRDGYDPPARVELFGELAAYFRSLAAFPAASLEGLTDEQYVRSVVRVIFAAKIAP